MKVTRSQGHKVGRWVTAWLLGVALTQALPTSAWAASVTVSGLRGGSTSLDLGELDALRTLTHEETTIRINNDTATQYRLVQELTSPLTNEHGGVLDAQHLFVELSGGGTGTLGFRGALPLAAVTRELFTSNASGTSETLRVIYSASLAEPPQAGTYVGTVTYTLQTVSGSSVDTVTLPMRLLVNPLVSIGVAGDSSDRIRFGALDSGQGSQPERLSLVVTHNLPGAFTLTQLAEGPILNERGDMLPLGAVRLTVAAEGVPGIGMALEPRMRLFESDLMSEGPRRIDLVYQLIVPDEQRVGMYRGLLHLAVAGPFGGLGAQTILEVPLEVEVLPVLSLSVSTGGQEQVALEFTSLTPGEASSPQALVFDVRSNMGQAYGVFQEFAHLLVSDEGRQLPQESFTCVGAGAAEGMLRIPQQLSVPAGRSLIYQSDEQGSSDTFSVTYQVQIPQYAAAGTYRSSLLFSVTSL